MTTTTPLPASTAQAPPRRLTGRLRLVLAVLLVAQFMLAVDFSILNIAESRPAERPRLDLPVALTVTLGLLGVVYGLTQAGEHGWTHPLALTGLLAGAVLLGLFHLVERRAAAPLVPLHVLRKPTVAWGNLLGLLAFVTETSLVYLLILYLQKTLGFTALAAGLSFGVLGLGAVAGGLLAPKAIARTSTVTVLVGGGLLQAVSIPADRHHHGHPDHVRDRHRRDGRGRDRRGRPARRHRRDRGQRGARPGRRPGRGDLPARPARPRARLTRRPRPRGAHHGPSAQRHGDRRDRRTTGAVVVTSRPARLASRAGPRPSAAGPAARRAAGLGARRHGVPVRLLRPPGAVHGDVLRPDRPLLRLLARALRGPGPSDHREDHR
ncbi:hypothetical protein AB0J71_40100 [Nonomuraea sp. NPDC049637]|uniref:hypothetical protein n=1 Tax=Nonomuraea sp. NPDC049637 TaxID=3154356 RepID=UPI0034466085